MITKWYTMTKTHSTIDEEMKTDKPIEDTVK